MELFRHGASDGRPVLYFHGTPGTPQECRVFETAQENGLSFLCFDRMAAPDSLGGREYFQYLAERIRQSFASSPVDLVGFSMGSFAALQIAGALGPQVKSLHLVSAAAPLDGGDFMSQAAGAPVFRMARNHPARFLHLARLQGLVARIWPALVLRMMFASAQGEDKALAADPAFRAFLIPQLKACLGNRTNGYWRDICAYVQPWHATLGDIRAPVTLWHGRADNWSPYAMAEYLAAALPNCMALNAFDGVSHYSCLYRAAPAICQALAGSD